MMFTTEFHCYVANCKSSLLMFKRYIYFIFSIINVQSCDIVKPVIYVIYTYMLFKRVSQTGVVLISEVYFFSKY